MARAFGLSLADDLPSGFCCLATAASADSWSALAGACVAVLAAPYYHQSKSNAENNARPAGRTDT